VKGWRRLGISLAAAAGLHAVVLLALSFPARTAEAFTTIQVSVIVGEPGAPAAVRPAAPPKREPAAAPPAGDPSAAPQGPEAAAPPAQAAQAAAPSTPVAPAVTETSPETPAVSGPSPEAAPSAAAGGGGAVSAASGSASGGTAAEPAPAGIAAGAAAVSAPTAPHPRAAIVPVYPFRARRAGYEGVVTVSVLIDETGTVASAEVISSSGHAALDKAALDAVRATAFEPARRDGKPVSSRATLAVRFVLN
jgi:periplasmic protein TonB